MPAETLDAALASILTDLPRVLPALCGTEADARRVREAGGRAVVGRPHDVEPGSVAAVLLVDDELGDAGAHAEELVARIGDVVHPGGLVVVTVPHGEPEQRPRRRAALRDTPVPPSGPRTFTPTTLEAALAHRGLAVRRLERHGDRLLALARAPLGDAERSARFVASLPFKLVTSAVVCTDASGRLLCVFDSFKRHWTVPGGVVDAGEDPRAAAVREAYEEGGLRVRAGDLLGMFCTAWPDRLLTIYAAAPLDGDDPALLAPRTAHPHEIGEVAWLPVDEALERLHRSTRWQVERCLESPGETWAE